MADVAARAGVSVATVSRALSGDRKLVSAPVLQRVLEAAEELSYTPNNLARNMRAGTAGPWDWSSAMWATRSSPPPRAGPRMWRVAMGLAGALQHG